MITAPPGSAGPGTACRRGAGHPGRGRRHSGTRRFVRVNAQLPRGTSVDVMPFRSSSKICPGDRLEIEVVEPDAGRARWPASSTQCRRCPAAEDRAERCNYQLPRGDKRSAEAARGSGRPRPAREADLGPTRQSPPRCLRGGTLPIWPAGRAGGVLHVKLARVGSPIAYAPLHPFCGYECATADRLHQTAGAPWPSGHSTRFQQRPAVAHCGSWCATREPGPPAAQ